MKISSGVDSLQSQRAVSNDVNGEITYLPVSSQKEGCDAAFKKVKRIIADKPSRVTTVISK